MNITTRSALVTGASSGIGLQIARTLKDEGFHLTLVARNAARLGAAVATVGTDAGTNVRSIRGSLSEEAFLDEIVAFHKREYGALDILVNNAGVSGNRHVGEVDAKFLDDQLAVNLRAVVLLTTKCLPLLQMAVQQRSSAQIINIASNAGKRGESTLSTYSATKAGVIGFTQALHDELSTSGIKATAVCPGMVDTPMADRYRAAVPAAEMISPRDVAEVVRMTTRLSATCIIPEIVLLRPTEWLEHRPETASTAGQQHVEHSLITPSSS